MRQTNPYPGALVYAAGADGAMILNRPYAYDALKQGDSPAWLGMVQKAREAEKGRGRHEPAKSNLGRKTGVLQHQ